MREILVVFLITHKATRTRPQQRRKDALKSRTITTPNRKTSASELRVIVHERFGSAITISESAFHQRASFDGPSPSPCRRDPTNHTSFHARCVCVRASNKPGPRVYACIHFLAKPVFCRSLPTRKRAENDRLASAAPPS